MKKLLISSLILSAFILFGLNIYYVLDNIPPDGRWKFQIPATSLFIAFYLILFFIISKKSSINTIIGPLILSFNIILSIIFIFFAKKIEMVFQDVDLIYLRYISTASYIIILGMGIIAYKFLIIFFEKNIFPMKD